MLILDSLSIIDAIRYSVSFPFLLDFWTMEKENYLESSLTQEDANFEVPLRPQALNDFLGQDEVRERLEVFIGAAKQRGEALGHCLLAGPPGLGKTTLAGIIAKTMASSLTVTSGPLLEKPGDLAGILTNLKKGDILFIDEIHRINRSVEEYLYPALEDFTLDLIIDSGPSARTVQVKLNQFTLVGATTRSGLLTAPMRSRFALNCRLDYYSPSVLENILMRSSRILKLQVDRSGMAEIAGRARGTPRIANNLLRWVRDYAQMRTGGVVNQNTVHKALEMLAIDERGLDEMDKRLLNILIAHYSGGPVGLNTLAVALGEEAQTIEEVYEPFLILQGFIKRTPRGRVATDLAYRHMGKKRETDALF
jgi:Holliday junction DNA helicase RuvB